MGLHERRPQEVQYGAVTIGEVPAGPVEGDSDDQVRLREGEAQLVLGHDLGLAVEGLVQRRGMKIVLAQEVGDMVRGRPSPVA